jgi:hypothetical protein
MCTATNVKKEKYYSNLANWIIQNVILRNISSSGTQKWFQGQYSNCTFQFIPRRPMFNMWGGTTQSA